MGTRESFLYWIVGSFTVGIALVEIFDRPVWILILFSGLVLISFFLAVPFKNKGMMALIFVTAFSAWLGVGRIYFFDILSKSQTQLESFVDQKIEIEGIIVEESEEREFDTRLYVQPIKIGDLKVRNKLKLLISTKNPQEFYYGDIIKIKGELNKPENFYTDSGREFNYVGYLNSKGIRFVIKNASIEKIGHDPPSKVLSGLFSVKKKFIVSLDKSLPEPQSSLAAGILIDGKGSINKDLQEKFRKTGIVHIVVLSGYNVSIVAEAIARMFSFLPRILGLSSSALGIILFAFITGGSATVIRASIMAIIVLLSKFSLRHYDPLRGLLVASFVMLMHNPSILIHNPSFQLSFLATFAVITIVPRVDRKIKFLPEKFGIKELVVSTITVQIFLLPMILWMNGLFSVVALPVNLMIVPMIPITMLVNFIGGLVGLIWSGLAIPFSFISYLLLSFELFIVDFFSSLPFAEVQIF